MFTNLKLGTKFTLLLSVVFIGGIIVSGAVLWQVLNQQAQAEITARGLTMIETMNAVRSYTSNHVRPLLVDDLDTEPEFISETVPAFSAREVFENLRKDEQYANFFYKEATINPTNMRDKADAFEEMLIEQMRANPDLQEVSDFRLRDGEQVFYIARPLAVNSPSCLTCHSDPEIAPASLIATYGSENGFGWQLDEIVAAQVVYVPAQTVLETAQRAFILILSIFIVVFTVMIFLLNYLLRWYVIIPVGAMGRLAEKISADQISAEDLETDNLQDVTVRSDELGQLAQLFKRMMQEVYNRTQQLKQQVKQLKIEIDEAKRQKAVDEIVETDFFQDLQSKVADVKKRRSKRKSAKSKSKETDFDSI